jgi:hypothetical protein
MTHTTHLRIAAAGLVIGPVLFTTGDLLRRIVEPSGSFSDVQLVRAVEQQPGTWAAAGLLAVLAAVFFLPGVIGLLLTAQGRGSRTTVVGAAMVGVGLVASVGHAVGYYGAIATYASAPRLSAAAITSLGRAGDSLVIVCCIALFMIGMMLGTIVLLVGLRRAHRVPIWSVVAGVVFVVCGGTGGVAAGVLGILASVAAFLPAAAALVGTTDAGSRERVTAEVASGS